MNYTPLNYNQQQYYYQPFNPYQNLQYNQQNFQQNQMNNNNSLNNNLNTLQGKQVDSIDVVKAMDIPLDGSISYYPLTDNSSIVTKQLMPNGTSRTIIYKPFTENGFQEEKKADEVAYVTTSEFQDLLNDFSNLKSQFEDLKKNISDKKEKKNDK